MNNERSKELARAILIGDGNDNAEENVSLLHSIAGNLMMATRQNADVRVLIGYLCILCVWLWDSPISIREFLSESGHLQMVSLI